MRKLTLSAALIISSAVSLGAFRLNYIIRLRPASSPLGSPPARTPIALASSISWTIIPRIPAVSKASSNSVNVRAVSTSGRPKSPRPRASRVSCRSANPTSSPASVEVEAAAPNHVTRFDLQAIPRPPEFPIVRLSEPDALEALAAKLQADSASGEFSGAVIVAKDGKPVFSRCVWTRRQEKKIPNKLDTNSASAP